MCIQWKVRCSYYADSIVVNKRKTCETSMPTAEETESLCQIFQEVRAQHRSVRQPSLWTKAWNPIISQVICMVMRTPCQKVIGALVLPWLSFHRSMLSASTQCPNYGIRSNDVTATTDRTRVGWKWFLVSMLRVIKKLTHCFWERLWHGCFIWSLPTKSLASTVGNWQSNTCLTPWRTLLLPCASHTRRVLVQVLSRCTAGILEGDLLLVLLEPAGSKAPPCFLQSNAKNSSLHMSDAVRHVGEWVQIQVCALEVFDSYFL